MSAEQLAGMLHLIAAMPDLSRGRCIGQWDLWDQTDDPAAIEHAIARCLDCPVLARCRDYINSLPASKRPPGVAAAPVNGAKS